MTTPGNWKQTIPPIQETDQVKASIVNRSINAVAERTDYLRAILDDVTTAEFTYVRNVAVAPSTKEGNLVYWDSTNNRYAAGIAQWDDTLLNTDGTLKPAESSAVVGILASKFTNTTGAIILGGYIRDFENLTNLFGEASPAAGVYYLSGSTAGQVTSTVPPLAIQAIVYDGNGNIVFPAIRYEHSTHDHKKYTLEDSLWVDANSSEFPDIDIPDDAEYGYDLENASEDVREAFTLYPGIAAFTYVSTQAGIPDATIYLNEDTIWWTDSTAPTEDIFMWLTAPNSHGPNIVRAIKSNTTDILDISLTNGLAVVDKKDFVESADTAGYTVVKDITDSNEKKTGDVVERIVPGEGISLGSSSAPTAGQGVVEITTTEFSTRYMDSDIINLNNALQYTVDDIIYTAFPAGRESSMLGVKGASKWDSGTKECGVWLWVRGPSVGGAPLPNISVEILVFPDPSTTPQDVPAVPETHTLTYSGTTLNSKYYLMETDSADRVEVTSQAQIQYKVTLDNTESYDILVVRQGIILY
jgi:hypothetical protein